MKFKWTDKRVKMFTQIYATNFASKLLDENVFKYSAYVGKDINEKIIQFKKDCKKRKNRRIVDMDKDKDKKVDNTKRDDIIKAICTYTGDSVGKVLPWVKDYLKK